MRNTCTTRFNPLGSSTPAFGPGTQAGASLNLGTEAASNTNRFYAMSELFKAVASAAMPKVNFTQVSYSGNENADYTLPNSPPHNITGGITLRVTPAPTQDLMIPYTVRSSNDATAGEDFNASGGTVTIPAGQTTALVSVPNIDDDKFEESETIRVQLTPSSNYLLGDSSNPRTAIFTIIDDGRLAIGLEQAEFWVLEDSGTFNLNLTLDHANEQPIDLTLAFAGTAIDGSDYTAPSTSVTIPSGNTSGTHTISIPITADSLQEADETIEVRIASIAPSRVDKVSPDRTTLYIADQDHASTTLVVPASNVEVREGEETTYRLRLASAPTGTVTVTFSGQSASTLTLDADDTMIGDQNSVQFTSSNWYIGRRITMRAVHDSDLADTTVTLDHSASNAGYGSVTGSAKVDVDDDDVTLSITGGSAVTEGTAAEFTVTASQAPDRDLTINLTNTDATNADFIAAGDQGNRTRILPSGQTSATFTVPTTADNSNEPSGPVTIAFRASDHYAIDSSAASTTVQVNDDDATAVTVTMSGSDGNADGNAVRARTTPPATAPSPSRWGRR